AGRRGEAGAGRRPGRRAGGAAALASPRGRRHRAAARGRARHGDRGGLRRRGELRGRAGHRDDEVVRIVAGGGRSGMSSSVMTGGGGGGAGGAGGGSAGVPSSAIHSPVFSKVTAASMSSVHVSMPPCGLPGQRRPVARSET